MSRKHTTSTHNTTAGHFLEPSPSSYPRKPLPSTRASSSVSDRRNDVRCRSSTRKGDSNALLALVALPVTDGKNEFNNNKEEKSIGIVWLYNNRNGSRMKQNSAQSSAMNSLTITNMIKEPNQQHEQTRGAKKRSDPNNFSLGSKFAISCAVLLLALCSSAVHSIGANGGSSTTSITSSSSKAPQSGQSTSAYGEPIKWSFGGWAPLDGAKNGTAQTGKDLNRQQQYVAATSPLPVMAPTARPFRGLHNHTVREASAGQRQPGDSLKESASSTSHEKTQFGGSIMPMQMSANSQSYHQHKPPQTGPAPYTLTLHKSPPAMQFSQPAPAPIVREHVLPIMKQVSHTSNGAPQRPPFGFSSHYLSQYHHPAASEHRQQMMVQQQQPHHGTPMRPPGFYQHQKLMQEHHQRQHQMFQQMFQHKPQAQYHQIPAQRGAIPSEQPQVKHAQAPYANGPMGPYNSRPAPAEEVQRDRSMPLYPGSPMLVHNGQQNSQPTQQQQMYKQPPNQLQFYEPNQNQQQPQVSNLPAMSQFKAMEGEERPIGYANSLPDERIPLLEIKGANRNGSEQQEVGDVKVAGQQSPELTSTTLGGDHHYGPTLPVNEKTNSNYQVDTYIADGQQQQREQQPEQPRYHYQQQSNNIQDIKQRQQYEQQQQKAASEIGASAADRTIDGSKASPYLTIPVAVETEGDKVLTPDDIKEIQKHVIKVLPTLKTADKIVKMADAHLTGLKTTTALDDPQVSSPEFHQAHYNEHKMTLKELEDNMGGPSAKSQANQEYSEERSPPLEHHQQQPASKLEQVSTASYEPPAGSTGPMVSQQLVTTMKERASPHHEQQKTGGAATGERERNFLAQHEYFVATGPMQEVGTVDADQMSDYNLIKNDLLNNFRYEPTRAQPFSRGPQTTGSTPPMPFTATIGQQPKRLAQVAQQSTPPQQGYFQQQSSPPTPRPLRHSFGPRPFGGGGGGGHRGRGHNTNGASTSTTKTIMGGRRVSDVMRPLIHTTPVPMTSPLHIPSVEPEKVDAIQLIAGNANDNRPMVVEPHQLVNHTPDGGFDFNSGAVPPAISQPQSSDRQPIHVDEQQQQPIQQPPRQQRQYMGSSNPTSADNDGAVIEYVAMNEPNSDANVQQQHRQQQQQQQQQEQTYEVSGQPEVPVYLNAEQAKQQDNNANSNASSGQDNRGQQQQPVYDYTMTTQPIQTSVTHSPDVQQQGQSADYGNNNQEQHTPQGQPQPSLAWSPSIANEHQQQQLELAEHAGPSQAGGMDMPATAGYNFFSQQLEQLPQTSVSKAHEYDQQRPTEQEDQSQQQHEQHDDGQEQTKRWRTKAGGSQPNPDAQYDGQMAKGEQEQEQEHEQQQQQHTEQEAQNQPNQEPIELPEQQPQSPNYANQQQQAIELSRLTQSTAPSRPFEDQEQQQHEQQYGGQQQNDNEPGDAYQQPQQQQQQQQLQAHDQQLEQPQQQYNQEQVSSQPGNDGQQQQQSVDGFMSTNSYVGGAQFDRQQPPSNANFDQQDQQQQQYDVGPQANAGKQYNYMKLDSNRQLAHLAKHQAQRQAQLAELLNTPSAGYQNTTPMSPTSQDMAQQQQQMEENGPLQEEKTTTTTANNNNGYMVEQVQSRPSVQSPPDAMLLNEAPPMHQIPISDQQSLISDPNQESNDQFSDDDRAKQQHYQDKQTPTAVYQVYQAYYAPKDHKPLPGYVRLSLEEFNELFRDAEIQYVDKNMNGLQSNTNGMVSHTNQQNALNNNGYEQQQANDMMKASASEQSIVVDRRSITDNRVSNSTAYTKALGDDSSGNLDTNLSSDKKYKLGQQGIKKIISIRNSRQMAKQQLQIKAAKMTPAPATLANTPTTSITEKTSLPAASGLTVVPQQTTIIPIVSISGTNKTPTSVVEETRHIDLVKQSKQLKKKPEVVSNKLKIISATTTTNTKQSKASKSLQTEAPSMVVIAHNLGNGKKTVQKKAGQ